MRVKPSQRKINEELALVKVALKSVIDISLLELYFCFSLLIEQALVLVY
jgi:hypothetical protein